MLVTSKPQSSQNAYKTETWIAKKTVENHAALDYSVASHELRSLPWEEARSILLDIAGRNEHEQDIALQGVMIRRLAKEDSAVAYDILADVFAAGTFSTRLMVASSLSGTNPLMLPLLRKIAESAHEPARLHCTRILASINHPDVLEIWTGILSTSHDPQIRGAAIDGALDLGGPAAIELVRQAYQDARTDGGCARIRGSLLAKDTKEGMSLLSDLLLSDREGDWPLCLDSATAAAGSHHVEAKPCIDLAMEMGPPEAHVLIAQALRVAAPELAFPVLEGLLGSDNADVVQMAMESLGTMVHPTAAAMLQVVADNSHSPYTSNAELKLGHLLSTCLQGSCATQSDCGAISLAHETALQLFKTTSQTARAGFSFYLNDICKEFPENENLHSIMAVAWRAGVNDLEKGIAALILHRTIVEQPAIFEKVLKGVPDNQLSRVALLRELAPGHPEFLRRLGRELNNITPDNVEAVCKILDLRSLTDLAGLFTPPPLTHPWDREKATDRATAYLHLSQDIGMRKYLLSRYGIVNYETYKERLKDVTSKRPTTNSGVDLDECKFLAYEALCLERNVLQPARATADALGLPLMVIANLSYGGTALMAIGSETRRLADRFIATKQGSTGASSVNLQSRVFSQEQIAYIMTATPIIVIVDGTAKDTYPRSFLAYRSFFALLDESRGLEKDKHQRFPYLPNLSTELDLDPIREQLRQVNRSITASTRPYHFTCTTPNGSTRRLGISTMPPLKWSDVTGPTIVCVVTAEQFSRKPPSRAAQFTQQRSKNFHRPAAFDDRDEQSPELYRSRHGYLKMRSPFYAPTRRFYKELRNMPDDASSLNKLKWTERLGLRHSKAN